MAYAALADRTTGMPALALHAHAAQASAPVPVPLGGNALRLRGMSGVAAAVRALRCAPIFQIAARV